MPSPASSTWAKIAAAWRLSSSVIQSAKYYEPPSGSATVATPVSWATICCGRSASRAACCVGSELLVRVGMEALGATERAG